LAPHELCADAGTPNRIYGQWSEALPLGQGRWQVDFIGGREREEGKEVRDAMVALHDEMMYDYMLGKASEAVPRRYFNDKE